MAVPLLRTLILYCAVICAVRLMGKRQIGELDPSELVVTILVSDLAAVPMQPRRDLPKLPKGSRVNVYCGYIAFNPLKKHNITV